MKSRGGGKAGGGGPISSYSSGSFTRSVCPSLYQVIQANYRPQSYFYWMKWKLKQHTRIDLRHLYSKILK